jgi:hypothetical protein
MKKWAIFVCTGLLSPIEGLRLSTPTARTSSSSSRRDMLKFTSIFVGSSSTPVLAEPGEFKNFNTAASLPAGKEGEPPFITLQNGVRIKEFKEGTGDQEVRSGTTTIPGSTVSVQVVGRLLNLNGVAFFDTKKNDPDGFGAEPLTFQVGSNVALPGFESGIIGMKKGGIRRIIVPSELGYSAFPDREPRPTTELDQRALDSVIKNPRRDASLLFDVKLERLK